MRQLQRHLPALCCRKNPIWILLNWLSPIAEELLPESQYGFCPNQGTIDTIFMACQLQEKGHEHWVPIHFIFWDLEKAFDSICRETLRKILAKYGVPSRFIAIIRVLHDNTSGEVIFRGTRFPPFPIKTGVKQGDVLAPLLFAICLAALHTIVSKNLEDANLKVSTTLDGNVFNLARLRAKTKTFRLQSRSCSMRMIMLR